MVPSAYHKKEEKARGGEGENLSAVPLPFFEMNSKFSL
jgi:hypothetical protein